MTSADCDGYKYLLYRNGVPLNVPHDDIAVGGVEFVTIMVTNVTKDSDNAPMQNIGTMAAQM